MKRPFTTRARSSCSSTLVTEGSSRFHLDDGNEVTEHVVTAAEYIVVPAGCWHTMDVVEPGRAVVITWGEGTQHRPR